MDVCDRSILNERSAEEISTSTRKAIDLIATKSQLMPVGTFKYRLFRYPSDVDLFENLDFCCTYNTAKVNAAKKLQEVAIKVAEDPDAIFIDFKAGYDNRFKIYTGYLTDEVEDYDPVLIRRDIKNLNSVLDSASIADLLKLVKDRPTMQEVATLNEALRRYWVVRWTLDEMIQGYKVLPGDYKLYLDVAVSQGSIVKIDIIYPEKDRYLEVSDFYAIQQRDRQGNIIILTEEFGDYIQSLLGDVYEYYDNNILKSIKRLWMLLVAKNEICLADKFTALFSSPVAKKAQIASDIETGIILLESNNPKFNKEYLYTTLNDRIDTLESNCLQKPIYIKSRDPTDVNVIIYNLKVLRECLSKEINIETRLWLKANNINVASIINEVMVKK